ncbi:MAG: sugar phosphate nucleotidyltransferase [Actinomycetes bacterium]
MMRALVLAAGSATRLRPLSPDLPKPLTPVANRPVLSWVLDHLDTAAVTEIGVIVPAGAVGLYERVLGAFTQAGTTITWLGEEQPVGSAGALRDQRAFIDGGPALVVPADIICPVDLSGMIAHHAAHRRAVTVAASLRDPRGWDGDILVSHPGHTARYLFKPGPKAPSRLGSTGTWLVEPALLDRIPPAGFVDLSSQTLPALPPSEVGLFDTGEVYLRDVGTLLMLLRGNLEAVQQENDLPLPPPLPGTRVMAEPGALIEDGAVVDGPVLIGAGAQVRSGAHVLGLVVIGPGAVLGLDCRVERALVLPGAVVPPYERVAGQVVGDGAAAVRALLKHADEQS